MLHIEQRLLLGVVLRRLPMLLLEYVTHRAALSLERLSNRTSYVVRYRVVLVVD
jgi:hypothetical protein